MGSSIVTQVSIQDGISLLVHDKFGVLKESKVISDTVEIDKKRKTIKVKEVKDVQ